jgi:hypothetical protein
MPWGALGINFYIFFIYFYHLKNFKMIVVKASKNEFTPICVYKIQDLDCN